MKKLYIFNPETDLAIAADSVSYTPPANVADMRRKLALLPALYAECGSLLLLPSDVKSDCLSSMLYNEIVKSKRITVVSEQEVLPGKYNINVWGWNRSEKLRLLRLGIDKDCLPSDELLTGYRELSHRKTTIKIHQRLSELLPDYKISKPLIFTDSDDAADWAIEHKGCYMKAPWSSSGRGIFCVTGTSRRSVYQWIKGVVRKQGSIIGEIGLNRSLDFATEWLISDNEIDFQGYSVFNVGSHGAYEGNIIAHADTLKRIIEEKTDLWSEQYLDTLKVVLSEIIAPVYTGPVGVDMLVSTDGIINPCVEINLRMTMGHVAIALQKQSVKSKIFVPGCDVEW